MRSDGDHAWWGALERWCQNGEGQPSRGATALDLAIFRAFGCYFRPTLGRRENGPRRLFTVASCVTVDVCFARSWKRRDSHGVQLTFCCIYLDLDLENVLWKSGSTREAPAAIEGGRLNASDPASVIQGPRRSILDLLRARC